MWSGPLLRVIGIVFVASVAMVAVITSTGPRPLPPLRGSLICVGYGGSSCSSLSSATVSSVALAGSPCDVDADCSGLDDDSNCPTNQTVGLCFIFGYDDGYCTGDIVACPVSSVPASSSAPAVSSANSSAYCGDNTVNVGEECDTGMTNSNIAPNACRTTCENYSCGDNVTDSLNGESCDGEGYCRVDCTYCGDGYVDVWETCDAGIANSDITPGACKTDCSDHVASSSSSAAASSAESSGTSSAAASSEAVSSVTSSAVSSTLPVCGNGTKEFGEACDPPDYGVANQCTSWGYDYGVLTCEVDCSAVNVSGCAYSSASSAASSVASSTASSEASSAGSSEASSDASSAAGSSAAASSAASVQPTGTSSTSSDASSTVSSSSVSSATSSIAPYCGDGVVQAAAPYLEECDDGNTVQTDGCYNDCTSPPTGGNGGNGGTGVGGGGSSVNGASDSSGTASSRSVSSFSASSTAASTASTPTTQGVCCNLQTGTVSLSPYNSCTGPRKVLYFSQTISVIQDLCKKVDAYCCRGGCYRPVNLTAGNPCAGGVLYFAPPINANSCPINPASCPVHCGSNEPVPPSC